MARIELDQVSLSFNVSSYTRVTIKEFIVNQLFGRNKPPVKVVNALQNVSLTIGQGERVGILGHNGAGKSTMLKLLAGVYPPSQGRVHVEGKISSLFDISLGFEADANGWDNINYRSYLQKETPATISKKRKEIAEFSELGDFLDMPVRFYSAGMMIRLAFAIATAIEPEVLLVDEVLAVGDLAFQHKAQARMKEMIARAKLMVVVSHDLDSLARMCNRALWLEHGKVVMDGPCDTVIDAYRASVLEGKTRAA